MIIWKYLKEYTSLVIEQFCCEMYHEIHLDKMTIWKYSKQYTLLVIE